MKRFLVVIVVLVLSILMFSPSNNAWAERGKIVATIYDDFLNKKIGN